MSVRSYLISVVCGALALEAASCNLPQRDNLRDPLNAPVAKLSVGVVVSAQQVDFGRQDGNRNTVFELDASASTDAHGRPLRFAFELDDQDCDTPGHLSPFASGNGAPILRTQMPLTAAIAGSDPSAPKARKVCVRADAQGSTDIVSAAVVLSDAPPLADPGPEIIVSLDRPPVLLDACGGAVTQSACTSSDPDGDALRFRWIAPAGITLTAVDPTGRFASFVPPVGQSQFQLAVVASDGLLSSTGILSVHLGSQVWVGTTQPTAIIRVFPDHSRSFSSFTGTAGTVAFPNALDTLAVGTDGSIQVADPDPAGAVTMVVRKLDRDFQEITHWDIGPQAGSNAIAVESSAPGCIVVRRQGFPAEKTFERLRDDGSVVSISDPETQSDFGAQLVAPAANGACWTIGTQVGQFQPDGSWSPKSSLTFQDAEGAAVLRDGTLCAAGFNGTEWGVWCVSPGSGPTDAPLQVVSNQFSSSLVGLDDGGLLVFRFDLGTFMHVSPATLESEFVPGIGPFQFVHQAQISSDIFGDLWIDDELAETLHRYDIHGLVARETTTARPADFGLTGVYSWAGLSVDPLTAEVYASASGDPLSPGVVLRLPWHGRFHDVLPGNVGLRHELAADPTRGVVWYSDDGNAFVDGGLSIRSDHGAVLARQPIPFLQENWAHAATRPDGGAWVAVQRGAQPDRLLELDSTLAVKREIQLAATPLSLDLSPDGKTLCIPAVDDPQAALSAFHAIRCDTVAGTCGELVTPIATALGIGAPRTVRAAAGNDGACWFLALEGSGLPPYTGSLVRVPPTASISDVDVSGITIPAPDVACPAMLLDPRNRQPWLMNLGQVDVYTTAGVLAQSIPSTPATVCAGVMKNCEDAADPACLDVWSLRGDPSVLYRSTADFSDVKDVIPLGVTGHAQSLSVRR